MTRRRTGVFCVASYTARKNIASYRNILILIILYYFTLRTFGGVRLLCATFDESIGALSLFPYAACYRGTHLIFNIAWLIIVCDAPFLDEAQVYVAMRTGRRRWGLGQLLYLLLIDILFWAVVFIITNAVNVPFGSFETSWGRVIETLTRTDASLQYGMSPDMFPQYLKNMYSPTEATLLCAALNILSCYVMGAIIFAINLATHGSKGIFVSGTLALLDLAFTGFGLPQIFHYISPVTLADLTMITRTKVNEYPSLMYAFGFLALVSVALSVICMRISARQAITPIEGE